MTADRGEAPDAQTTEAPSKTKQPDFATDADAARKEFARLQAHAAMAGWRADKMLGETGITTFIVHRWGRCIDCSSLAEVRAALLRVGVAI